MKVKSASTVTPLRLTAGLAQKRIRELAVNTKDIILTTHAKDQGQVRDIDITDIYNVLRTGFVDDAPTMEPKGAWKCKVIKKLTSGGRTAGVVTIVASNDKLIVLTVEWEDGK